MMFSGKVFKRLYAAGSKSEREAVMIKLPEGDFLLRRLDGNPFYDEAMQELVGKTIECDGELTATTLIIKSWKERSDAK